MDERLEYPVCYECKHCQVTSMGPCVSAYDCGHPLVMTIDIVTGARRTHDCADQRKDDTGKCGIEGRLWERKIPWWAKLADRIGMLNARIGKT